MSTSRRASEATKADRAARRRAKREARRQRGVRQPVAVNALPPHILIVCEGEKTEPYYFEGFQLGALVEVVGPGAETIRVVEEAIRIRDEDGSFTEIWVVIDRDDHPRERFEQALSVAAREHIGVAYSNQAFELWYLLHFDYCDADLHRDTYAKRLEGYLGRPYHKNDKRMFEVLEPHHARASACARKLIEMHGRTAPYEAGPSTTVYRLVERLFELRG